MFVWTTRMRTGTSVSASVQSQLWHIHREQLDRQPGMTLMPHQGPLPIFISVLPRQGQRPSLKRRTSHIGD